MAAPCALCPRSQCGHTLGSVYRARVVFMFRAVRYPISPGTPHVRPFHHTTPSPAAGLRRPPQRARSYPHTGAAACHYGDANPGGAPRQKPGVTPFTSGPGSRAEKKPALPRTGAPERWLCASHAGYPSGVAICAGQASGLPRRGSMRWATWGTGGAPRLQVGLGIQSGSTTSVDTLSPKGAGATLF